MVSSQPQKEVLKGDCMLDHSIHLHESSSSLATNTASKDASFLLSPPSEQIKAFNPRPDPNDSTVSTLDMVSEWSKITDHSRNFKVMKSDKAPVPVEIWNYHLSRLTKVDLPAKWETLVGGLRWILYSIWRKGKGFFEISAPEGGGSNSLSLLTSRNLLVEWAREQSGEA